MSFLHAQDGLVRAGIKAEQTAFAIFRLVNESMAVEPEIHFSENMLRADIHTCPTGLAAAGIQVDITSLHMM